MKRQTEFSFFIEYKTGIGAVHAFGLKEPPDTSKTETQPNRNQNKIIFS